MDKKIIILLATIVVVASTMIVLTGKNGADQSDIKITPRPSVQKQEFDGRNSTFIVEGAYVTLVDGISEEPIAGSAEKITTRYFGNESAGDLNADGLDDQAFLITQSRGGSGLFYYVVVALKSESGYKTTNAFLVGDRIAPQSTEIHSDSRELRVNFAKRKTGEPMTARPSVGATLFLKVNNEGVLEGLMM